MPTSFVVLHPHRLLVPLIAESNCPFKRVQAPSNAFPPDNLSADKLQGLERGVVQQRMSSYKLCSVKLYSILKG
jgi:hypothetical protein